MAGIVSGNVTRGEASITVTEVDCALGNSVTLVIVRALLGALPPAAGRAEALLILIFGFHQLAPAPEPIMKDIET